MCKAALESDDRLLDVPEVLAQDQIHLSSHS